MLANSNVMRMRSSSEIGSNCDAVVIMLSTDERRDIEGELAAFFFASEGTRCSAVVSVDSQLELVGRCRTPGRVSS